MTGFVYIWRDKKHKRYYVGSHWGNEDDGYVCSSSWMLQAYKKRQHDFKRRILERFNNRDKINEIEHRWLQMMKEYELKGKKYYNFHNHRFGHWSVDEISRLKVGQKISLKVKGQKRTPEQCEKMKGHTPKNKGVPMSEEQRLKLSVALKGRPITYERSLETRAKISDNSKRLQREQKVGMHGKKHTNETRLIMSSKQAGNSNPMFGKTHSPEAKAKIAEAVRKRYERI